MKRSNKRNGPGRPPSSSSSSGSGDEWLMTYADSITLLMAFFVMLFSISQLDQERFVEVTNAIERELGHRDPGTVAAPNEASPEESEETDPVEETKGQVGQEVEIPAEDLEAMQELMESLTTDGITLHETKSGFEIELDSKLLYVSGSAEIRKEVMPLLSRVGDQLKRVSTEFARIDVQGHTDSTPITSTRYASNWELSAARATGVVRFLITKGVRPNQISASAFADTQPRAVSYGRGDRKLQAMAAAANRRVVIRVDYEDIE